MVIFFSSKNAVSNLYFKIFNVKFNQYRDYILNWLLLNNLQKLLITIISESKINARTIVGPQIKNMGYDNPKLLRNESFLAVVNGFLGNQRDKKMR